MIFENDPLDVDYLMNDGIGVIDVEVSPGSAVPVHRTLVDWCTLSDADARAAWDSLREQVEWFSVRYRIPVSIVPTC